MAITQIISQFPDAPDSSTDTPVVFNQKADAFVKHQHDDYVSEVNTWTTQANGLGTELDSKVSQAQTHVNSGIPTGNSFGFVCTGFSSFS